MSYSPFTIDSREYKKINHNNESILLIKKCSKIKTNYSVANNLTIEWKIHKGKNSIQISKTKIYTRGELRP